LYPLTEFFFSGPQHARVTMFVFMVIVSCILCGDKNWFSGGESAYYIQQVEILGTDNKAFFGVWKTKR
jgi:hypothetical protein